MAFPLALHDHPPYAYDAIRPAARNWTRARPPHANVPDDADDPYEAGKESPLVDTLVEGAVVLLIAALINLTFWGIVRFGVTDAALHYGEVA